MNELIRQLALEAFQPINDITTEGVADRRTFDQAWFQHYNEKFAELIVKECLTIMQDANQSKLRLSDAIWNTKIHFGVEE